VHAGGGGEFVLMPSQKSTGGADLRTVHDHELNLPLFVSSSKIPACHEITIPQARVRSRQTANFLGQDERMGKGRRIKFEKGGRVDKILKKQLRAFRKKFGRDPGQSDPVFFDPDADTPQPMPRAVLEEGMREVAKLLPPDIAYAYLKTDGLLVTEANIHLVPKADLEEWDAAIAEYWRLADQGGTN
jgi:hypothetical protein